MTEIRGLRGITGQWRGAFVALVLAINAFLGAIDEVRAQDKGQGTLRVTLHSDLKVIDPVWTSALITTHHAFMIYDQLFALDEKLAIKPQMVDTWSVSDDKLTWTFKLRQGLAWHDGVPVTADDCVASIKRWAIKDGMGQKLMGFVGEIKATDPQTFVLALKEPYGLVLDTLGKATSNVLFIMPKRVAEGDANTQLSDTTGSGPYIFKRDEWKPGEKAVYVKNPNYVPRAEPASGYAGGKVVKVDRVEWVWIADTQTQVNALVNGEIDLIEAPPHDLVPLLKKDPNVALLVAAPMGRQYALRFNLLHKPFDNDKIRQAVAYALNQKDFLDAVVGNPEYYVICKSLYPCGSPNETLAGWGDKLESNFAKARALIAEAGYDGTPVVMMQSTDNSALSNLAPVAKSLLEKIGLKVDLQATDWQSVVARRVKKDPPAQGGWNVFFTSWGSIDVMDPVSTNFFNASCEKATFGWPCDATLEKLRDTYARETDVSKRKAIAESVQVRVSEYPTHIHLGQYLQPTAYRKNLSGLLVGSNLVLWNVSKK
jgi:peptide/nickel transport system substrate-binding protein